MKIKLQTLDYAVMATMLLYSASATLTPICLLAMAHELDFSLSAGGGIEGVRSLLIFLSLFVSGFIAARLGKLSSLAGGLFMLAFGFGVYAWAPVYAAILLASFIIGGASGILEGLLNPLVQDLHPQDSGRYLNITNAFWSVGVLSTVILAGDLLTRGVSWRLIMAVLAFCALAAGISLSLLRKKAPHTPVVLIKDVAKQYLSCARSKRFWVFCIMMIFAGGSEGAFTFWSASYIQVNFKADPRMGGLGTACFAAGMMTMRFASGLFVGQNRLRRLIFISALSGALIGFVVPFAQTAFWFFLLLFLAGMSIACFWPSIQSYAVQRIPYLDATAAFILMSCAGIPGFGLTSLIMGFIGDRIGLGQSFFLVPVLLLLLALVVLIERGTKQGHE